MTFYPYANPEISDLHIKLLLPPSEVSEIKEGAVMKVYSGREYLADVKAAYSSSFVSEVSDDGKSLPMNQKNLVVIRMEIIHNYKLKGRYETDNLPVTLYHEKISAWYPESWLSEVLEWFVK